ncbi:MAG: family 1 glycosylhydrolase [Fimbriimonas sp.]
MKVNENRIPVWGGIEATVNRVGDRFQDQFDWSRHPERLGDFDRIAELGIRTLRTPILWERVLPEEDGTPDWSYPDAALERLRALRIAPIAGLCHHGSGPRFTNLLDPEFPEKLAAYARRVAERYPWIEAYTPVNEPLTTARFSALYGHWYPHARDDRSLATALFNQVRGVVLAMREIRQVNPNARLVQTDDLGKTHATSPLRYQADLENERRWLTWDLLCGTLTPQRAWWKYFVKAGIAPHELQWFLDHPCPPDVIGVNHYISSERFLDHRIDHYEWKHIGGNGRHRYADVLAARVRKEGCDGFEGVLAEAWDRYHLPIAVTECHMGCTREEQMRWLVDGYEAATRVRDRGADVAGFTVWSLFGAYDWNSLLTRCEGQYEPGVFDLRSAEPRPTALAEVVRALATGAKAAHPALPGPGWWQREIRFEAPPVSTPSRVVLPPSRPMRGAPLLITGANGMLAKEFVAACGLRGIHAVALGRAELDVTDSIAVQEAFQRHRPWAVVNAAGRVGNDDSETDAAQFFLDNTAGAAVLADVCARNGTRLVTFSSDYVFDGTKGAAYDEEDDPSPIGAYGRSQSNAERCVANAHPDALVIRTGTVFGPWDARSEVYRALSGLAAGHFLRPDEDRIVSPTYAWDLAHTTLDLLMDGESGIWHLTNAGSVRFSELVREIACQAGLLVPSRLVAMEVPNRALASGRGCLLPRWEDAVERYVDKVASRFQAANRFSWK